MLIPNLNYGGAQKVFADHSLMLASQHEVIECAFNFDFGHEYKTSNKVISLGVPGGTNIIDKTFRFYQRIRAFNKLLKREHPDIVISHLEGAHYINLLSNHRAKRLIVMHGSMHFDENISASFSFLRKKIMIPFVFKKADKIIAVSEGIKSELIKVFGLKESIIEVIYNFFNLNEIEENYNEEVPAEFIEILKNRNIIINTGRLASQKNQLALPSIIRYIKSNYKTQITLVILGDGELLEDLINECITNNLNIWTKENKTKPSEDVDIIFAGYQTNPLAFYKHAELFVFPSAWEGFPLALGEAMSTGLAVISSDCPTGPKELITPSDSTPSQFEEKRFGILLDIPNKNKPNTIEIWANQIVQLVTDKGIRNAMGINAKTRMKELDYDTIKIKWFQFLDTLRIT